MHVSARAVQAHNNYYIGVAGGPAGLAFCGISRIVKIPGHLYSEPVAIMAKLP